MSDAAWYFLAAVPFAVALWDIGRRAVPMLGFSNAAQRKEFADKLEQHEEKYKLALQNAVKQVREEVDSISAEIGDNVAWTRKRLNDNSTDVAPWQQAQIDNRNQARKRAQRFS